MSPSARIWSPPPPAIAACRTLRLPHGSHHPDQLVDHRIELLNAPLNPTNLVAYLREHLVHLGLSVVHLFHSDEYVSVPGLQVDPPRDLARTDTLAECVDDVDVVLQRRHIVTLRRHFACHHDRRERLYARVCVNKGETWDWFAKD